MSSAHAIALLCQWKMQRNDKPVKQIWKSPLFILNILQKCISAISVTFRRNSETGGKRNANREIPGRIRTIGVHRHKYSSCSIHFLSLKTLSTITLPKNRTGLLRQVSPASTDWEIKSRTKVTMYLVYRSSAETFSQLPHHDVSYVWKEFSTLDLRALPGFQSFPPNLLPSLLQLL